MKKRAHIVVNPRSGGLLDGDAGKTTRLIESRLVERGYEVTSACPPPDELEGHLHELDPELHMVVAAGGDGTLGAVGAVLTGRRTALAIVPLGTVNVLAEDLSVPTDIEEAIEVSVNGKRLAIDVATVNGRKFFIQAVLGVAAELAERREKMRGAESVAAWAELATGAASDLLNSTRVRYDIRTGRRHAVVSTRSLIISNNRLRDRRRLMPFRRSLSGQVLALYALRGKGPLTALRFAVNAVLPGRGNPAVREIVAHRMVINAGIKEDSALIDGEIVKLDFPATFEILPAALNVIVPGS